MHFAHICGFSAGRKISDCYSTFLGFRLCQNNFSCQWQKYYNTIAERTKLFRLSGVNLNMYECLFERPCLVLKKLCQIVMQSTAVYHWWRVTLKVMFLLFMVKLILIVMTKCWDVIEPSSVMNEAMHVHH